MILWQYTTQTDYRVIAIYMTAACGTLSQPWTWTRCEERTPGLLSPTSLLTDSQLYVRRRYAEARETFAFCE